jgi:hypothetical protein
MKTKEISDKEYQDLLFSELDNITDLELLILKGHILVEYSLNKFINEVNNGGVDIDKINFTFHKKITIAEILGLFNKKDFLKQSIVDINKLRNQIAHTLTYEEKLLKGLIKGFVEMDKPDDTGIHEESSDFSNFYNILIAICATIMGKKLAAVKLIKFTKHKLRMEMKSSPEKFEQDLLNFEEK